MAMCLLLHCQLPMLRTTYVCPSVPALMVILPTRFGTSIAPRHKHTHTHTHACAHTQDKVLTHTACARVKSSCWNFSGTYLPCSLKRSPLTSFAILHRFSVCFLQEFVVHTPNTFSQKIAPHVLCYTSLLLCALPAGVCGAHTQHALSKVLDHKRSGARSGAALCKLLPKCCREGCTFLRLWKFSVC
jgi:hypothetical protein